MAWLSLVFAGLFEVGFTSCLYQTRNSKGDTQLLWGAAFVIALTLSIGFLIRATQTLPLGITYAIWTGIGVIGTVAMSIFIYKEPINMLQLLFLLMLVGSIVGLKLVTNPA